MDRGLDGQNLHDDKGHLKISFYPFNIFSIHTDPVLKIS